MREVGPRRRGSVPPLLERDKGARRVRLAPAGNDVRNARPGRAEEMEQRATPALYGAARLVVRTAARWRLAQD